MYCVLQVKNDSPCQSLLIIHNLWLLAGHDDKNRILQARFTIN